MQSQAFDLAQTFIWRNARLIDRHLFAYLFRQGPKTPVITALKAYQNVDGGFGNALEPNRFDNDVVSRIKLILFTRCL